MGGRSVQALARRAEKRGRTLEEEEAQEKLSREKKWKEAKPEKPQELERPKESATVPARRRAAGVPARPGSHNGRPAPLQRHIDDLFQLQRELNGKLAHGSRQEIYDLVHQHVDVLNSVNVATALHRLPPRLLASVRPMPAGRRRGRRQ